MNEKNLLYAVSGLVLGVLFTGVFATNAVNSQNAGMMRMMGMNASSSFYQEGMMGNGDMHDFMDGMTGSLEDKTGDLFDQVFLAQMIVHHQGAVEMANLALQNANHMELKNLANEIIKAQTTEINQMREWQEAWFK